jgi:hypothetical protein
MASQTTLVAIKKKKQIPFQIWGKVGTTTDQKKRRANDKRSFHTDYIQWH